MKIQNLFSIQDKVALVTGGSRGIGEMIAHGFLANGAKVYISSRKANVCDETARRLSESTGGECISLPADLSEISGIEALATEIAERESQLDILVNNAGAAWGQPIDEFSETGWDKVMDVNVKSVFFLTQKLLPLLRKSGGGDDPARVINVGSIDGLHTPAFETYSYGPSKIAPGPFPTYMLSTGVGFKGETEGVDWDTVGKMSPSGRVGGAEDIAGLAIFLSSRAGAYTVGEVIACDGGIVASS